MVNKWFDGIEGKLTSSKWAKMVKCSQDTDSGMSELLRFLPKNNPDRPRIMQGYKTMMASLLKYQAEDGMWRQLIDDPQSWKEISLGHDGQTSRAGRRRKGKSRRG